MNLKFQFFRHLNVFVFKTRINIYKLSFKTRRKTLVKREISCKNGGTGDLPKKTRVFRKKTRALKCLVSQPEFKSMRQFFLWSYIVINNPEVTTSYQHRLYQHFDQKKR